MDSTTDTGTGFTPSSTSPSTVSFAVASRSLVRPSHRKLHNRSVCANGTAFRETRAGRFGAFYTHTLLSGDMPHMYINILMSVLQYLLMYFQAAKFTLPGTTGSDKDRL